MPTPEPPAGKKWKNGRLVNANWGGRRGGSGRKGAAASTVEQTPLATMAGAQASNLTPDTRTAPSFNAPGASQPRHRPSQGQRSHTSSFFLPRDMRQPVPAGEQNNNGSSGHHSLPSQDAQSVRMENDEYGDIASGHTEIDDSLVDEICRGTDTDTANTAEAETEASEAKGKSPLSEYLLASKNRIVAEIKKYGQPLCYKNGHFFDRPMHPVFALHHDATESFGPAKLYHRDIFVWLPHLLPKRPERFVCICGKHLTLRGYNDNPVARRVRRFPVDYFLLTNRFCCDHKRADNPGCGASFQGTNPHIISQLPRFVQEAFPAFISTRGAMDKQMMWEFNTGIVRRLGPSPFAELVCELQSRFHAQNELMYYAAALHFGLHGEDQVPAFSWFDDPDGFAGSPPSTSYLKAMYTDYIGAHRIYMDRVQATLPLDIAKGDHTFDVLKYMGGVKGEKIWKAAYNLVNQFEEVRAESLTLTKSMLFLREMLEKVQVSLKAVGHRPTALLYTDSPQLEQGFHETIMASLAENVQHVTKWTDLPPLQKSSVENGLVYSFSEDSMMIEDLAADILEEASKLPPTSVYVVALGIKFHFTSERVPQLDVIQIRTQSRVLVLQVSALNARSHFVPSLKAIFTSPSIIKVGFQIQQTLSTIADALSLDDLKRTAQRSSNPVFVDMGQFAKLAGIIEDPQMTLHGLVGAVLSKSFIPRSSDTWFDTLDMSSVDSLYLETDCVWQLWSSLSMHESVGLRLQPDQVKTHGQLVTLVHGCKAVARGSVEGHHPGYLDAAMADGETRRINITASRSLIRITEVLVPHALHTLHHQTIEWIFTHGKQAVVTTSQLRSRNATPPIRAVGLPMGFALPAPDSSTLAGDHTSFSISYSPGEQSSEDIQFDMWEATSDDEYMDEDSDFDSDIEYTADDDDIRIITSAFEHARDIIQRGVQGDPTLTTRVLDDAFHFMDRLLRLLSKKHSAFKAFCHDFSEAIFIRDKDDEAAVRAILEKQGVSWEYAKRARAPALNRRIRRYIPDRHTLTKRLTVLFTGYQDIFCSTKNQPSSRHQFFSDDAKEMATRLLETVRLGFLSDPPNIPLYYLMGRDRDGLNIYRTIRGTNSVEGGVHMAVRRVFGSLKASPELAECLLINWIFRRNQSVGYRNRTGRKFRGHFDIWLSDEIVEIATLLGVKPSFPMPRLLATRIATSETFGILPVDTTLAADLGITTLPSVRIDGVPHHQDQPVHVLSRLSTRPINQYRYLQLRQRTLYPVLPVATFAEYHKFKLLITNPMFRLGRGWYPAHEAYKNINFKTLAQFWNNEVNIQDRTITDVNQRLYYKLPGQLELHHKKTLLWKSEPSDDNAVTTLPPIPLPGVDIDEAFKSVQDLHANVDLDSFDPMALRPERAQREQRNSGSEDVDDAEEVNDTHVPMEVD
ncbi:hypothetical protein BDZ89DRAFT_1167536 [Hymenopellis radicata]|nr:hypothetical protein BDZ89DRAFT_1167536 [Hymenopellis radicata]